MSELIVLGLIPGTQIQITFLLWVIGVVLLGIGLLTVVLRRKHFLRDWIISLRLMMLMRQTISEQL